jgi:hypothetical protein
MEPVAGAFIFVITHFVIRTSSLQYLQTQLRFFTDYINLQTAGQKLTKSRIFLKINTKIFKKRQGDQTIFSVTRLGEFLPIGRLFTFGSLLDNIA